MSRRVLYFFPYNLFASQTGVQQRGLEILEALRGLGCETTLFSSVATLDKAWNGVSASEFSDHRCRELILHKPSPWEVAYLWAGRTTYHALKRWSKGTASKLEARSINGSIHSTPSMRECFHDAIARVNPDIIFMTYCWWDGLVDHERQQARLRIIDTIDVISVTTRQWASVEAELPPGVVAPEQVRAEVLQEDFFDTARDAAAGERLQIECDVYDRYDVSIAISAADGDTIRRKTRKTRVVTIPMTRAPVMLENSYRGAPLFAAGLNPYNVHGYAYFASRVLPILRESLPAFSLEVTGGVCKRLAPVANVRLRGMVDRLDQVYADAPFVINPAYGGTGQQVKIVDAMAHGVPVVTLARAAAASPIRHGENGLIASDAREFAEHVALLWRDRDLCRRMGNSARATIADECSPARLKEALAGVIDSGGTPALSHVRSAPH